MGSTWLFAELYTFDMDDCIMLLTLNDLVFKGCMMPKDGVFNV